MLRCFEHLTNGAWCANLAIPGSDVCEYHYRKARPLRLARIQRAMIRTIRALGAQRGV